MRVNGMGTSKTKFFKIDEDSCSLQNEYERLREFSSRHSHLSNFTESQKFPDNNRFFNALPYDHTLFKSSQYVNANSILFNSGNNTLVDSPYVNANNILVNEKPVAIATQGPMENDIGFWRMVFESDSDSIVSLGPSSNWGEISYHSFWEDKKIGEFEIHSNDVIKHQNFGFTLIQRTITLKKGKKEKKITHFLFEDWPHANFAHVKHIGMLIQKVIGRKPIVHCSSGLGRTGTFLAIFLAYTRNMSLYEAVKLLRDPSTGRNPTMVQTIEQYHLAHQVIEWLKTEDAHLLVTVDTHS